MQIAQTIDTLDALRERYGDAIQGALDKVQDQLTPCYRAWLETSRFCILSTVGPEGTDASPRGDVEPVVRIADARTLLLPDWRGNNRVDSLSNIVRDGRVSLLFMVNGSNNVVRVNGTAKLAVDDELLARFERRGKTPRSVIVVSIGEVYYQCAKALMRSALWAEDPALETLPTAGAFNREFIEGDFDADAYDRGYAEYAAPRMW